MPPSYPPARAEPGPPRQAEPARTTGPAGPGRPRLLRELNDRAALELLLGGDLFTRAQISQYTGVSKVTAAQMLARLQERGLVTVAGHQAGGRGPNAVLYSVIPSSAYAAGLHAESGLVSAAVADVTGHRVAEVSVTFRGTDDPAGPVRVTVERACARAGVEVARLSALVIGSPGATARLTGNPQLAASPPTWPRSALGALRGTWPKPVMIENDVNLAAMAGGCAVRALAARYGFAAPTPAAAVRAAVSSPSARSSAFLDDLGRRVAVGVASVCVVLSPELVVLGGEIGRAGGTALATRVAARVTAICPSRPRVVPAAVPDEPVLHGALVAAVDHARTALLASVVTLDRTGHCATKETPMPTLSWTASKSPPTAAGRPRPPRKTTCSATWRSRTPSTATTEERALTAAAAQRAGEQTGE